MKSFNWIILSIIFFLLTTSSICLAEEMEDKPIARVFDKYIYSSDISPEKEVLEYHAQLSGKDFDKWENEHKIKSLKFLIYSELQNIF